MKYIKRFSTHSEYEGYVSGNPETPNISACDDDVWATFHCINSGMTKNEPLCFTSLNGEAFDISHDDSNSRTVTLYYSEDGLVWKQWPDNRPGYTDTIRINSGRVFVKGYNPNGFNSQSSYSKFNCSKAFRCSGNIMSLLGDYVKEIPNLKCFCNLFESSSIVYPPELPATVLKSLCYEKMFSDCKSLLKAPELKATTLVDGCYQSMFQGCSSLVTAPHVLPAQELKENCYKWMFASCTALRTPPEILATTTANLCCYGMFSSCHAMTTSPVLYSQTVAPSGYCGMFENCYSLDNITCAAYNGISKENLANWLNGANILNAATDKGRGKFYKSALASTEDSSYLEKYDNSVSGIPYTWVTWDYFDRD